MDEQRVSEQQPEFQAKLPARITGLVFWGLVFVGLLTAVIALQRADTDLTTENRSNSLRLVGEIEDILERYYEHPINEYSVGRIRHAINILRDELGFSAVTLQGSSYTTSVGMIRSEYTVYHHKVQFYPKNATELNVIDVDVYFPNEVASISSLRKNILLTVGLTVFIFGLLLQRILNRLLAEPFQKMVNVASQFTAGDKLVRFDEKTQDEFGYLGGFINQAIQSLLNRQDDLNDALDRAERSEDDLKIERDRAEVTLTSISDAVVTVDFDGVIRFINPSAEALLNITADDAENKLFGEIVTLKSELTGEELSDPLEECFNSGGVYKLPDHTSLIIGSSAIIAIEASVASMKNIKGELIGAVIVIQDVSRTRKLTRQLSYQASHDMLTGLYNRRKFEEILNDVLNEVRDEGKRHTFCYLDLDQFKIVNDTCGHIAGDELLRQIPDLFHQVLRAGDIVARLGGDEFGILLENCNVIQASQISDKIRQQIKDFRFVWNENTFEIGVSIGVVGITEDNADLAIIMSSADVACYAAKDSGRNRVHVYESSDNTAVIRHGEMHWTSRIQHALTESRFKLYRQPIVGLSGDNNEHFEVLLRMLNDEDELIPPGAFLPAAERYNMMCDIDRWVISDVFKYIADDPSEPILGTNKIISINLSGDSVNDADMLSYIIDEKQKYGVALENICFEITETVAITNMTKATDFMGALKKIGCRFSLDDFGSGLSSFAYLKNLPVDYLKIDGSFIRDISHDEIDRAMVTSIHQIGEVMSLKTVAEKVEDEATLSVLKEIGVDYVQGFHMGKPEPLRAG